MSLEGRLALVSGSSRGIGRAIALALARAGANIVIHGRTSSSALHDTRRAVEALGVTAHQCQGDVRRAVDVERIMAEVGQLGPLHILVNNAAMASFAQTHQLSLKQWDATLSASLRGPFLMATRASELMTEGWGRIINVSSLGGRRYLPGYGAMGAAKAGLESLTRTLAVELAPRGIGVNAVVGGMTETQSARAFPREIALMREAYLKASPMRRPARPEDLADVVALMCRDEARWIVGQTVVADGGFSLI